MVKTSRSQPTRQAAFASTAANAAIFSGIEAPPASFKASPKAGVEAQKKRLQRRLEELERTNYSDTPTSHLHAHHPEDGLPTALAASAAQSAASVSNQAARTAAAGRHRAIPRKPTPGVRTLLTPQYRKSLSTLLDENPHQPYLLAEAAPPMRPPTRRLCLPCGYLGAYICDRCGEWVCSKPCKELHDEAGCIARGG